MSSELYRNSLFNTKDQAFHNKRQLDGFHAKVVIFLRIHSKPLLHTQLVDISICVIDLFSVYTIVIVFHSPVSTVLVSASSLLTCQPKPKCWRDFTESISVPSTNATKL